MKKQILILLGFLTILLLLAAGWYLFNNKESLKKTSYNDDEIERIVIEDVPEDIVEPVEEEVLSSVTITFTGDFLIGDIVKSNYDSKGMDGVLSPELRQLLAVDSDITMVNNEFPYSTRGDKAKDKQFTFRLDPSYVSMPLEMGVDVAGLANNHVLDYGSEALEDTLTTLEGVNIDFVGSGYNMDEAAKLVTREINGVTYGFMASSHIIPFASWDVANTSPGVFTFYNDTALLERIAEYKTQCDYLFVCVHWGVERTDELEDYQINEGHAMIDAGADAVIGMHSHCLQPVEMYKGKPIFYSLGNFIFGTNISSAAVVSFTYEPGCSDPLIKVVPTCASNGYTTEAQGDKKQEIISYLMSISDSAVIDENGLLDSRQ